MLVFRVWYDPYTAGIPGGPNHGLLANPECAGKRNSAVSYSASLITRCLQVNTRSEKEYRGDNRALEIGKTCDVIEIFCQCSD